MRSFCLMLTRLALAAWVGAAVFFVMVSLRPLRSREIPDEIKPHLTQTLFPGYYRMGFGLLGLAWVAGAVGSTHPGIGGVRRIALIGLITALMLLIVVDWIWIYTPLANMMQHEIREHDARAGAFRAYHVASMSINSVSMALTLVAAGIASWPVRSSRAVSNS